MLPIPIMLYFLHYTDTVTLDNHFPTYLSARNIFPYMVIRRWGLEAESMLGLNRAKLL